MWLSVNRPQRRRRGLTYETRGAEERDRRSPSDVARARSALSPLHTHLNMSGRRLYVGRIPPDAVKRDLEEHFASLGRLVDIRLMNGFAFIEYDRLSDAEQAVQELGNKDFMGERLLVEFAKPPRERDDRRGPPPPRFGGDFDRGYDRGFDRGFDRPPPPRPVARGGTGYRLVVSNLREGTSWQDLKDFARQVGNCAFSDVDRRDPTVGYIEYALRGDADEAVRRLNESELNGVVVNVAEDASAGPPRASSSRYDDRASDRGYSRRDDYPPRRDYDDRGSSRRTRSPSPVRRDDRDGSLPRRSPSPRRSRSPERERDARD
ncbi:mRNA-binding protein NPL3 [Sporobolomyces koalae]|uniref:mRNA-binding protein NPL3 n=1 Tax=Sporobolomyces koalae TaxID=500713 RepID=UPI003179D2BD